MRLFHTTDSAKQILANGFHDGAGSYGLASYTLRGVFVAKRPAGISDGADGDQVLEVVLPDDVDLADYAIADEGYPAWEWCLPADLLNSRAKVRLLAEQEADEAR